MKILYLGPISALGVTMVSVIWIFIFPLVMSSSAQLSEELPYELDPEYRLQERLLSASFAEYTPRMWRWLYLFVTERDWRHTSFLLQRGRCQELLAHHRIMAILIMRMIAHSSDVNLINQCYGPRLIQLMQQASVGNHAPHLFSFEPHLLPESNEDLMALFALDGAFNLADFPGFVISQQLSQLMLDIENAINTEEVSLLLQQEAPKIKTEGPLLEALPCLRSHCSTFLPTSEELMERPDDFLSLSSPFRQQLTVGRMARTQLRRALGEDRCSAILKANPDVLLPVEDAAVTPGWIMELIPVCDMALLHDVLVQQQREELSRLCHVKSWRVTLGEDEQAVPPLAAPPNMQVWQKWAFAATEPPRMDPQCSWLLGEAEELAYGTALFALVLEPPINSPWAILLLDQSPLRATLMARVLRQPAFVVAWESVSRNVPQSQRTFVRVGNPNVAISLLTVLRRNLSPHVLRLPDGTLTRFFHGLFGFLALRRNIDSLFADDSTLQALPWHLQQELTWGPAVPPPPPDDESEEPAEARKEPTGDADKPLAKPVHANRTFIPFILIVIISLLAIVLSAMIVRIIRMKRRVHI